MSEAMTLSLFGGALAVLGGIFLFLVKSWTNESKKAAEKAQEEAKRVAMVAQTSIKEAVGELKDTIQLLFTKLDKAAEREAVCRAELPTLYSTKGDVSRLEDRTDRNAQDIAALKARLDERKKAVA